MTATTTQTQTTVQNLAAEKVTEYREQGFVHVPGVISKEEAAEFRQAALDLSERMGSYNQNGIFTQLVNAWVEDETIRRLTMHPNIAAIAERLSGVSLRLWHDQTLIKQPHNKKPTEFHQDQPLWPHDNKHTSISAWVALCDVPFERGCMTFLPGSHTRTDLEAMNLGDPRSVFEIAPNMTWSPRVTLPIQAGDCTFHNSRTVHMANENDTDEPRVAHIVLMMDAETTYRKRPHPVTDPLELEEGAPLTHDVFPRMT